MAISLRRRVETTKCERNSGLFVMELIDSVSDIDPDCTDFALFSGGDDSVVSTHVAQQEYDIDWVVYLDTNTGI